MHEGVEEVRTSGLEMRIERSRCPSAECSALCVVNNLVLTCQSNVSFKTDCTHNKPCRRKMRVLKVLLIIDCPTIPLRCDPCMSNVYSEPTPVLITVHHTFSLPMHGHYTGRRMKIAVLSLAPQALFCAMMVT